MIYPFVLVAGATGGVGQFIVRQLVARGVAVRAFVRDAARARELFGPYVALAVGDLRAPGTIPAALESVTHVICATGTRTPAGENRPEVVDYRGVRDLVTAARDQEIAQFILISSIAVTRPDHWLNRFGNVLDWKLKGEDAVRESGVPYTIIRPGGLNDESGGQLAIVVDQGDTKQGRISRADVAAVAVAALDNPDVLNTTFEIINDEAPYAANWTDQFASLQHEPLPT